MTTILEKPTIECPDEYLIEHDGCHFPRPDKLAELGRFSTEAGEPHEWGERVIKSKHSETGFMKCDLHADGTDGNCFNYVRLDHWSDEHDDGVDARAEWRDT